MQSSYNVIKNNIIKNNGLKEIATTSEVVAEKPNVEIDVKNHIESYEQLAKSILKNAQSQSEQIVLKAYEDAKKIQEEAAEQAEKLKEEAYKQAHDKAYSKAYLNAMNEAKAESEAIISSAMEFLNNAKLEYEEYLQKKSGEINNLIITIAKAVLKKEVQDKDSINNMIYEALEMSKKCKNFIIRCNSLYVEELKAESKVWKQQLGFSGDIFVVGDDSLEPGKALIDKGNGSIVVGIDYALEKIQDIVFGKE